MPESRFIILGLSAGVLDTTVNYLALLVSWGLWTSHSGIHDDGYGDDGNHPWSHKDRTRTKIIIHTEEEEAIQKQFHKYHIMSCQLDHIEGTRSNISSIEDTTEEEETTKMLHWVSLTQQNWLPRHTDEVTGIDVGFDVGNNANGNHK